MWVILVVYTLLNVDRGVPGVWGSLYDVRDLLKVSISLRDGRTLTDMKPGIAENRSQKGAGENCRHRCGKLLKEYNVI